MHLLITGGAGFIGRALQEFLQARYSYKLYAPSSSELDLRDCHAVSSYIKARKISHIIHLANRGGGRDTMGLTDLAEYNLRMFFAIMSQADRVEKILHFGSGAEYSKHKPIVSASEPSYLEALPLDSYGFYKNIASRFIESTRGNVICLRNLWLLWRRRKLPLQVHLKRHCRKISYTCQSPSTRTAFLTTSMSMIYALSSSTSCTLAFLA